MNDLQKLLEAMKANDPCILDNHGQWSSSLPTFGGDAPADTAGVWSWDENSLIIGECAENLEIVPRSEHLEDKIQTWPDHAQYGRLTIHWQDGAVISVYWGGEYIGPWNPGNWREGLRQKWSTLAQKEKEAKLEAMARHGADYNLVLSQGYPEGLDKEGATCPDCGCEADYRECDECSKAGWVIDCGHYAQPRPIAPLDHRMFCDECFKEWEYEQP